MKILSSKQMREADAYTISNEPIASVALMERAGEACFQWIKANTDSSKKFIVVCGSGNNGGDGLVIARLLHEHKYNVEVILLRLPHSSPDFNSKLEDLQKANVPVGEAVEKTKWNLPVGGIVIDAIFGTGLTRPVSGWLGDCIDTINSSNNEILSIDLPSGLNTEAHTDGKVIQANHTLTFEVPKLAFFFSENEKIIGRFHLISIGLDKRFMKQINSNALYSTLKSIRSLLKERSTFSHKGNYGHGLLISGSKGKMGAAILAARACLRTGSGLLTVRIPNSGTSILQTAVPEAMASVDEKEDFISDDGKPDEKMVIGIGPGIGKASATRKMLFDLLGNIKSPMVIDADALNLIAENPVQIKRIPPFSILTPHPKEFERLAGTSTNEFDRHERQIKFSVDHKLIVVLKGAYTCISTPNGTVYFNSTGNPGMAKGGSGDALTGIILSLLCQKYEPLQAALLGVYLHGLAGDFAAQEKGVYSMLATDLIECLPKAFLYLQAK